ncbi:hypothetical protein ACIRPK_34070 [Kitasatospora sp. NPDC101801]|uniref:hypothetical protein n=1 Tax=Bacillati TaxID=1783272 RepID=UPI0037F6498B
MSEQQPAGTPVLLTCAYPDCVRQPEAKAPGATGPAPKYCDLPEHTALTSFRERKRRSGGGVASKTEEVPTKPVKEAVARATTLRDDVLTAVSRLQVQLDQVVDRLQTMADPEAAAAEIQSITAEQGQKVADAEKALADELRRRLTAEKAQAVAEAGKATAEEAAGEADSLLEQEKTRFKADAERLEEEKTQAIEQATQEAAQRVAELQAAAEAEVAEIRQTAEEAVATAQQEAQAEVTTAQEELSRAKQEAEAEVAKAQLEAKEEVAAAAAKLATFEAELQAFKTTTAKDRADEAKKLADDQAAASRQVQEKEAERVAAISAKTLAEQAREKALEEARSARSDQAVAEGTAKAKDETIQALKTAAEATRTDHAAALGKVEAKVAELEPKLEKLREELNASTQRAALAEQALTNAAAVQAAQQNPAKK